MQAEGTEKRVCDYIAARQQFGKRKYGTTVEANPLELRQWLQHMLDELLDGLADGLGVNDSLFRPTVTVADQIGGFVRVTVEVV